MKVFFRTIHLYLSLAAGLVIMIACFTGAVLVFEKELQEAFYKGRYYVEQAGSPLPLEQLVEQVQQELPGAKVTAVKMYADPSRSAEISVNLPPKEEAGAGASGGGKPVAYTVFVNPYSAQVLDVYNYRDTFFFTMFSLHRWLLGPNDGIGKYIVGTATFFFLFILITGLILWFPKTQKVLVQRLKLKWDGGLKRLNHDLHLVLGFYSAIFLFIFAFTGLAWSFEWFNKGIYTVTRTTMETPEPPASAWQEGAEPVSLDEVYRVARTQIEDGKFYNIRTPKDSAAVFTVNVLPAGVMETASDNYFLDQYSGQIIGSLKFDDKNLGQRVRGSFKPIHTSSLYGLPSKIIGFIVCVLGVTFPVTGTILWINRLRKGKKKARAKQQARARAKA
ncbi:PepSY-associated TM helix domain-containing protein [soil metagenome]